MAIHPLLTGPRVEEFWVELLDEDDRVIQSRLDGVHVGGTVEKNVDAVVQGGCSFVIDDRGKEINWFKERVRPWVAANGLAWPCGIFLPDSPKRSYSDTTRSWTFNGVDKLAILDQDKIAETVSLPVGTGVLSSVEELIHSAGETSIVMTEDQGTLREMIAWTPGTSKLRMIKDLLNAINYEHVWVDGFGQYRIHPYVEVSERPVSAEFIKGETAIHKGTFTRTQDILSVPNMVVMTTQGSDQEEAMIAVATNEDPDSPYSYQARGNRWVTKFYEGAESVDQASLDSQARRNLSNNMTPPAYINIVHALVPLEGNQLVRFVHDDIDRLYQVNEYRITFETGAGVEGVWREI